MSRIAALHRERAELMARLAEVDREIADEYAAGAAHNDQRPRRRKTVQAALPQLPDVQISEFERKLAEKELARLGFVTRKT